MQKIDEKKDTMKDLFLVMSNHCLACSCSMADSLKRNNKHMQELLLSILPSSTFSLLLSILTRTYSWLCQTIYLFNREMPRDKEIPSFPINHAYFNFFVGSTCNIGS